MNRFGSAKGELVGGNLSILYSLFGSPSSIEFGCWLKFVTDSEMQGSLPTAFYRVQLMGKSEFAKHFSVEVFS